MSDINWFNVFLVTKISFLLVRLCQSDQLMYRPVKYSMVAGDCVAWREV